MLHKPSTGDTVRRRIAAVLLAALATLASGMLDCTRPAPLPAGTVVAPQGARAGRGSDKARERDRPVSEYSLYDLPSRWQDQRGTTLQLPALGGRVRVLAMVYTSCTVTCPLIVAELKRIEAAIPAAQRQQVGFVLVSLDPWRDTPGRLAAWATATGLDSTRWTLLAGNDGSVRELAASLDVRYQRRADGEIAHTNGLTVLDQQGRIAYRQTGIGQTDATVEVVHSLLR